MNISQELRFLRNYKRAVSSFNMLDRNMAYCLWWAAHNEGKEVKIDTLHDMAYDKKFKKVKSLIERKRLESEYGEFVQLAEECRKFRNRLVHGEWELNKFRDNIRFDVFVPSEEKGTLTHEEFEALADRVAKTNSQFCGLRKTYPIEN